MSPRPVESIDSKDDGQEKLSQNDLTKGVSPSPVMMNNYYHDKMRNVDINQTYFQDRSSSRLSGNLKSYERPISKTSFSRHFSNDRRQSIASNYSIASTVRGLRPTNSLSLLPLVRSCADAGMKYHVASLMLWSEEVM